MTDSDPVSAAPTSGLTLVCGGPAIASAARPGANEQTPRPAAPGRRGVYLRRHQARVIEEDNLLVVEFVGSSSGGPPPPRAAPAVPRPPVWQAALRWGASLSARTGQVLRAR